MFRKKKVVIEVVEPVVETSNVSENLTIDPNDPRNK
jgi:hypothetical protein